MKISEAVLKGFHNAAFTLNDKRVEMNEYLLDNVDFIVKKLTDNSNQRGLLLHLGTNIPFYLAVVLAAFKTYVANQWDESSYLDELNVGDLVIYEKKRGVYKGRDSEGRIIVENFDRGGVLTVNLIPDNLAGKISPYYGRGKTLDGRGIRNRDHAALILSELFSIEAKKLRNIFNKSVVVVCDRSEADRLVGELRLSVKGKSAKISELFPAAYYTGNDQYPYPGNSAGAEPVLKFTSRLSVARELIIEDKRIDTLIIGGEKYFSNDISEMKSIFDRSTLQSILLMGAIHRAIESSILDTFQGLDYLIWTEDRIRKLFINNTFSTGEMFAEESKHLARLIRNNIDKTIEVIKIDSFKSSDEFVKCKRQIYELSKDYSDSNTEINRFIVKSFWLMNLMEKSFFPLHNLEELIAEGVVRAQSPKGELEHLRNMVRSDYDPILKSKMEEITNFLHKAYEIMFDDNPKFQFLKQFIYDRRDQRIVVVAYRSYYESAFRKAVSWVEYYEKFEVTTPTQFRDGKFYDHIVFVGMYNWKPVNPLLLGNAPSLVFMLYPSEISGMKNLKTRTISRLEGCRTEQSLSNKPVISDITINGLNKDDSVEHDQDFDFERDLENFVDGLISEYSVGRYAVSGSGGHQTSRICRIALLDTGEKVFFTRYYSAYVFDSVNRIVYETAVPNLKPGDQLLFPNYDDQTRDIVEHIMDIVVENDKDGKLKRSRLRSRYWKQVLRKYMRSRRLSYRELSDRLNKEGLNKHEVTLRSWLDKDSRIVGPRDVESYRVIAKLTQDPKLLKNPEKFWQACNEVRLMRIRILRFIGKNIVRTYGRQNEKQEDELLSKLPINVSKMTRVVEIEKIVDTDNFLVAANWANRPICD